MKNWILAARPKTLTAALVPIIAATALVKATHHEVQWWVTVFALLASLFIQIGTNYVNDAIDFKKGADTKERLGPTRVTASGVFTYRSVMTAAVICFALALLCGIPLVVHGGWPIVVIGLLSLFFGYGYTGGPFPLAYLGLGDLFVVIFFGLIAVMGLFFLHTGFWSMDAAILGLQVGLHCTILIAINNLRDVNQDRMVNKKTLPVRFGNQFGRYEVAALCFAPFVLNLYWFGSGWSWPILLSFASLPLAIKVSKFVFTHEPSREFNQCLAKSAGLHLLFGILLSIGLIL